MAAPTLCLNMIVKNESRIMTRLLDSVVNHIDSYCICDTGSTDDTVKIIEDYFAKHPSISGLVFHEPFRDFAYSRNVALRRCAGMSDYALLVDADMMPQFKTFNKALLAAADAFSILQGTVNFMYRNMRIVRNDGTFCYRGVTHEYIDVPPNTRTANLGSDLVFILDIGDGGSKSDKSERDIRLLKQGLVDEPKNDRYFFYLANTYFDSGQWDLAEETYRQRIEMGGWHQEVWYSWYRIGLAYQHRDRPAEALAAWLEAYEVEPNRLENLYEIIKYYRLRGKSKVAKLFYEKAEATRRALPDEKKTDFLFLSNDVYTHKLAEEWTISAFYTGVRDIRAETLRVFKYGTDMHAFHGLVRNMRFYDFSIPIERVLNVSTTLIYEDILFKSSSPSLIAVDDGYLMNIRLVNYGYDKGSGLITVTPHPNIITMNISVRLDANLVEISRNVLFVPLKEPRRLYMGVEDVRLYKETSSGAVTFMGTGYHKNDTLGVVTGVYPDELNSPTELRQNFNPGTGCEKNWVHVLPSDETEPLIIYGWHPVRLCRRTVDNEILIEREVATPPLFAALRGSTHACAYDGEIWFVTHFVEYGTPRRYYHMILVFDEAMTEVRRVTAPFMFETQEIEYCLGLIVEKDRLLCSFSTWDETSKIAVIDKASLTLWDWQQVA